MTEDLFEQIDEVMGQLQSQGWSPRVIELGAADRDRVRVQVRQECGIWVKPDGLGTYREIPIAPGRRTGIAAERDGRTKRYPLAPRPARAERD